jgi:predicted permease
MAAIPFAFHVRELRLAARRLRHAPSFTLATVLVLGIGIGATTTVFSIVNGVVLRPLPYPHADRLVSLGHDLQLSGVSHVDQSDASILLYQRFARAFDGVAGVRDVGANIATSGDETSRAERVNAAAVSANLFDVLQVPPTLGRGFRAGEDRVGAAPVAVVSNALWERRFHSDPAVVGKRVIVDGVSREIVGVMPRGFAYPSSTVELWIPIAFDPPNATAGSFNFQGIGRVRAGITLDAAKADLERVLPRLLDEYPSGIPRAMWESVHVRPTVSSLRDAVVGETSRVLWILLGSVSLLLVIACANAANLFLVRGEARGLELAVRAALGSGVAGIVVQCLSEALVLAIAGGLLGVGLAVAAVRAVTAFGGDLDLPRITEIGVDARVLGFAAAASALCALVVSILPILRARQVPVALVLREAGRGATAGAARQRARSVLVVAQVALALVLVASSGLLARSFERVRHVRLGFDPTDVIVARLALPSATYATASATARFYMRLSESVRAVPGVTDASITSWVPLTNDHDDTTIETEDHPLAPNAVGRVHFVPAVDERFFHTMGIPFVAGRTFETADPQRPAREVIVSRAFAERYWPGESPLGKRLRPGLGSPWFTVVGEVGDVHFEALEKPAEDAVYFPLITSRGSETYVPRYAAVVARVPNAGSAATARLRQAVRTLDPTLPTFDERSLMQVVASASTRARILLWLLATASSVALLLGAVGIYGVMAYGVSLRQREIGVRMALGARPGDVRRMVARGGLGLAALGVVIGVGCAIAVTRLLRGLLYDVSPTDPITLAGTAAVLLLVSLAASWIPARRASSVDPVDALRGPA